LFIEEKKIQVGTFLFYWYTRSHWGK